MLEVHGGDAFRTNFPQTLEKSAALGVKVRVVPCGDQLQLPATHVVLGGIDRQKALWVTDWLMGWLKTTVICVPAATPVALFAGVVPPE